MKRLALVSAALLVAAACSDETEPARAAPTAPAPTFSRSGPTLAPKGLSTVCMSYMTQLANAEEKLERKPADITSEKLAKLEKQVESLDKLVADACR